MQAIVAYKGGTTGGTGAIVRELQGLRDENLRAVVRCLRIMQWVHTNLDHPSQKQKHLYALVPLVLPCVQLPKVPGFLDSVGPVEATKCSFTRHEQPPEKTPHISLSQTHRQFF
jgi:hypothetical protein